MEEGADLGKKVSRASKPAINMVGMAPMSPQDRVNLEVQQTFTILLWNTHS